MASSRAGDRPDGAPTRPDWHAGMLDAVLAATPDLVFLCDPTGTFLYANAEAARHWERPRADLLGQSWSDLGLPPEVIATLQRQLGSVFDTGRSLIDGVPLRPEGTWEAMMTPMQGEAGVVEVVAVALRDVDGRRRAERALRESEEIYRLLAENSTDMISRHDPKGRYLYVSPACRTIVGYEPEELLGNSPFDFIQAEDLSEIQAVHEAILHSTGTATVEFRVRCKAGHTIWLETTVRTIRDRRTGAVVELQCASRDVSARKEAEAALRQSRAQLQGILDNSTAVIYVKDSEGRYLLVNRWFETLFNFEPGSAIGKTDENIFPADQARAFRANDLRVLEEGKPLQFEESALREDGVHTYISIKFPIEMGAGMPPTVGGISTDITERKLDEDQLLRQNALLQEAVRSERQAHDALKRAESQLVHAEKLSALGQLVAGVAHEINNPLAFVTSDLVVLRREVGHLRELLTLFEESAQTLAEYRPDLLEKIRAHADRVDLPFILENLDSLLKRSSGGLDRIRQIVRDLRDFARLDEGDLKEVDLNQGVTSTINIIQGRARTKEVELALDLGVLPGIVCYPGEVNQVVLNLVSNAVDACSRGGRVTIRTRAVPDGVEIHVIDTGHGISPAIRGKIFDPFFTTKPVGEGTGLGLSISYGIVRTHGGTIEVESEPGSGAHFIVRLPLAALSGRGRRREP